MITKHKLAVIWVMLANAFVVKRFPRELAAEIVGKEGVLVFILLFASPLAAAAGMASFVDFNHCNVQSKKSLTFISTR